MPFSKVPLPIRTDDQLLSFLRSTNLPGGVFLFHGTSDHNRSRTIDLFSRYFLCVGTQDESCPCASCRLYGNEHPDLFEMSLSEAGNLLVGTVRDAVDFMGDFSTLSDRRCLVVRDADKLTPAAEGGLLKVLEQESDGTMVILACRDKRSLPLTLLSRSKMFFTGDASKETYFSVLSDSGMRPKKAEELSKLSPFLSVDPLVYSEIVEEAHKVTPQLFTYILAGETTKALSKFSAYANGKSETGVRVLAEVLVATVTDFFKSKFHAPGKVSMPSRAEWYFKNQDLYSEQDLNRCLNAMSRVVTSQDKQVRALFIWAIGAVTLLIKTDRRSEDGK